MHDEVKLYPEIAVSDSDQPPAAGQQPARQAPPWEAGEPANGAESGESGEDSRPRAGRPGYARRSSGGYSREELAIEIVVDSLVIVPTRPAKEQVANHLLTMISMGVFGPGDRLPPERWLAQQSIYNLTRAIVQDAYDILERMGVIERVANKGAFVRSAESSRMYFTRQHFLDAIGAAIRTQLTKSQIERAFHEAIEMMFSTRDPIRANTRRQIRAEMQLADERKRMGEGKDEPSND